MFLPSLLALKRPLIMAIMNITPDSFSDGGKLFGMLNAIEDYAYTLKEAGADILDLGAESTRPGAQEVSAAEECDRLLPVLERLDALDLPISVDTYKTEVMRAVLRFSSVEMINDIYALQDEGAVSLLAEHQAFICLMHMQGTPRTMQLAPTYHDVTQEVYDFLVQRIQVCETAGIQRDRLILDPGFGFGKFGKNLEQNCELFKKLTTFSDIKCPLLVGVSRKTMLGALIEQPVEQRVLASAVAALLAAQKGAKILRVHDVMETKQAFTLWHHLG